MLLYHAIFIWDLELGFRIGLRLTIQFYHVCFPVHNSLNAIWIIASIFIWLHILAYVTDVFFPAPIPESRIGAWQILLALCYPKSPYYSLLQSANFSMLNFDDKSSSPIWDYIVDVIARRNPFLHNYYRCFLFCESSNEIAQYNSNAISLVMPPCFLLTLDPTRCEHNGAPPYT